MFNFVVDQITKGRIYPALAQWQARPYTQAWREFGQHWPYTTPLRLQEYCNQHGMPMRTYSITDDLPDNTYYPVAIGFFDFTIDYLALLDAKIKSALHSGQIRLLFMYHEGDNPRNIKTRLDQLCGDHFLPPSCYVFVSSNTAAESLPGFVYFNDFELWYYQRNLHQPALDLNDQPRTRDFTMLSRIHKSWRATVMADLYREHLLDHSYWSYCQSGDPSDMSDCPIEIDRIARLRWDRERWLRDAPYLADSLTDDERNDHSITLAHYHQDAYCNIVLESQFDVDGSGGAFLTEKTFKPIKHGQMFVIVGAAGSLAALRQLGYRTFDHAIDPSYDLEPDATERWIQLRETIRAIHHEGLDQVFQSCREDILHNQALFCANKISRLNILAEQINEQQS